jgi:hypothetical protein
MVKVKLFLGLTKYYAMKTYPVLKKSPHHKDTWRLEV